LVIISKSHKKSLAIEDNDVREGCKYNPSIFLPEYYLQIMKITGPYSEVAAGCARCTCKHIKRKKRKKKQFFLTMFYYFTLQYTPE